MITPAEIAQRAVSLYGQYLKRWVASQHDGFFPALVPANLKLSKSDFSADLRAIEQLRAKSKKSRGWGYTLEEREVKSPEKGHIRIPVRVTIDSHSDLLRLARRKTEFSRTCKAVEHLRAELPELEEWLVKHVRTLPRYYNSLDGLIAVARYFLDHPIPECYPQQLPVEVDTKFISRHTGVLRLWLDHLLPSSSIQSDEAKFFRRYGMLESQSYRRVRLLDTTLMDELGLPFAEFAAPVRSLARLPVADATVVVVENRLPVVTVPPIKRGLVLCGDGADALALGELSWLTRNRVLYWGDIDAAGFEILSRLRACLPQVESVMMDLQTLQRHESSCVPDRNSCNGEPRHLSAAELKTYSKCRAENLRLEQEKLLQSYVQEAFQAVLPEDVWPESRSTGAP